METHRSQEGQPLEFKDTAQATDWTLDRLEGGRKKTLWPRKNKYQKAKEALAQGDWQPSQNIIAQAYEAASDTLETARINLALLHPQEKVHRSTPIVKKAVYFAILVNLLDQQIRLGSNFSSQTQNLSEFNTISRMIATREYGQNFSAYSVPQSLRELSLLASEIKIW